MRPTIRRARFRDRHGNQYYEIRLMDEWARYGDKRLYKKLTWEMAVKLMEELTGEKYATGT